MIGDLVAEDLELVPEQGRDVSLGESSHGQPCAHRRPIGAEDSDDDEGSGVCGGEQCVSISRLISLVEEKVRDGPVMPDVVFPLRLPSPQIGDDCSYMGARVS